MGKNKDGKACSGSRTSNGDAGSEMGGSDVAKAFDTLAKVIKPDTSLNSTHNDSALDSSLDQASNDDADADSQDSSLLLDVEGMALFIHIYAA